MESEGEIPWAPVGMQQPPKTKTEEERYKSPPQKGTATDMYDSSVLDLSVYNLPSSQPVVIVYIRPFKEDLGHLLKQGTNRVSHIFKGITAEDLRKKFFETMGETLNITKGLVARGYSDKEIMKIQGGNFLKLFEKVWKQ